MKIAVYAICGANEPMAFAHRMMLSCGDAVYIIIALTAPNPGVEQVAKEHGAVVFRADVVPFRFDDARNAALAAVPADADMCIAMDMDEVLEPGWREHIEAGFAKGATNIAFTFDTVTNGTFIQNNRIHSRAGWRWKYPAHEALVCSLTSEIVRYTAPGLVMRHLPDPKKPRCYLNPLAWGEFESPADPRMKFYYARELMFFGYYAEAINKFNEYLTLAAKLKYDFPAEMLEATTFLGLCEKARQETSARGLDATDKVGLGKVPAAGLVDGDAFQERSLGRDAALGKGE